MNDTEEIIRNYLNNYNYHKAIANYKKKHNIYLNSIDIALATNENAELIKYVYGIESKRHSWIETELKFYVTSSTICRRIHKFLKEVENIYEEIKKK